MAVNMKKMALLDTGAEMSCSMLPWIKGQLAPYSEFFFPPQTGFFISYSRR